MRDVLRVLWEGWKAVAAWIGHQQTRLLLWLIYFVVITPSGICARVLTDPLSLKQRAPGSRWRPRARPDLSLEQARRE